MQNGAQICWVIKSPLVWEFVYKGNYMGSRLRFFLGLFTMLFYFSSFLLSFSKLSNENKSLAISIFQNYIKGPASQRTAAPEWLFSRPGGRHQAENHPLMSWVLVAAARICRRPWSRDVWGQKSLFCLFFFFCQTQSCLVLPDPELRTAITIHEALTTAGGVDFPDSSGKWWQPSPLPASEKALPCLNLLWERVVFLQERITFLYPKVIV